MIVSPFFLHAGMWNGKVDRPLKSEEVDMFLAWRSFLSVHVALRTISIFFSCLHYK